jgi:hypothetical protein
MLFGEAMVGDDLLEACCHKFGGSGRPQDAQVLDHLESIFGRRHGVFTGMSRLKYVRDLPDLG